ncbi:hypothetical protein NXH76_00125 [Blautia schinkii]|nr:hypothetical protein [Blautia schinkii]
MRATGSLAKRAKKAKRAMRRYKLLKPIYKNRKRLAHVLKSVGQAVEKRL